MLADPTSLESTELKGYAPYRRIKADEYRIIFYLENDTIYVPLIGKRNDDDVYKLLERFRG